MIHLKAKAKNLGRMAPTAKAALSGGTVAAENNWSGNRCQRVHWWPLSENE